MHQKNASHLSTCSRNYTRVSVKEFPVWQNKDKYDMGIGSAKYYTTLPARICYYDREH